MEFFEVIKRRRSCRKFKDVKVPDGAIETALDAALKAPNSNNMQCWEFYWVKSNDKKSALVKACLSQDPAKTANHLIVAVSRADLWKRNQQLWLEHLKTSSNTSLKVKYSTIQNAFEHGFCNLIGYLKKIKMWLKSFTSPQMRTPFSFRDLQEVYIKTTALACENFMLAIYAQGYGCCPMEGFDEVRVKNILALPYGARVVMVIGVGEIDPSGIFGEQFRHPPSYFLHTV